MPKIIIAIGNVGCGKSTVGREMAKREFDTVIVNKDAIREMLYGEYGYKEALEPVVQQIAMTGAVTALLNNLNVFLDETNLTIKNRTEIVRTLRAHVPKLTVIYLQFPMGKEGLERRKKEPRNMKTEKWEEVWEDLNSIYEPPTPEEGYDHLMFSDGGIPAPVEIEPDAIKWQREFCKANNIPMIIPSSGECPRCKKNFLAVSKLTAANSLITSCPYCKHSFCN
jgi:predicted kinase